MKTVFHALLLLLGIQMAGLSVEVAQASLINNDLLMVQAGSSYINSGTLANFVPLVDVSQNTITLNWIGMKDLAGAPYRQVFTCNSAGEYCGVTEDSLGFAKQLLILTDGSLVYWNTKGMSAAYLKAPTQPPAGPQSPQPSPAPVARRAPPSHNGCPADAYIVAKTYNASGQAFLSDRFPNTAKEVARGQAVQACLKSGGLGFSCLENVSYHRWCD